MSKPFHSFPRREDVDRSNSSRSSLLSTESKPFFAKDGGTIDNKDQREKMLANFMAPAHLDLRVEAQVMLIKNLDETLVNGSTGKILRFVDPADYASESSGEAPKDAKKSVVAGGGVAYPVVQFHTPQGLRDVMIQPETWKVELPSGEVQVSRTQVRFFYYCCCQLVSNVTHIATTYFSLGNVNP